MSSPEEPGLDGDVAWDDVVDVICVGVNPGVLAYARLCADRDLDVLLVGWPTPGPDPQTADYLAAMTEDLDAGPEPEPAATTAVPAVTGRDRRRRLEPFVGEQLRLFSARCLAAPSGVLFTEVPGLLAPMRTDTGELVTAAAIPADRDTLPADRDTLPADREPLPADREPLPADREEMFAGFVVRDGRVAGAALDGPAGRRLVGAEAGLVFAVGSAAGPEPDPRGPLALVGRPAGRFARVQPLTVI